VIWPVKCVLLISEVLFWNVEEEK